MCICWQVERGPPPCAPSRWQTARYITVLSHPPGLSPFPGQIEHVILCSHLISPSHPVTEHSPLLQRENVETHTARQWNWQRKSRTHTHTLGWPLCCHHKAALIFKYSRASISSGLPFSVIFLPLYFFLSSSSQPFLCSLSILTGVCSFWLSPQSIGHIQFIAQPRSHIGAVKYPKR